MEVKPLDCLHPGYLARLGFKIRRVLHIGEQTRVFRFPAKHRAYSAFAIDGRSDLSMVIYNPTTQADVEQIESLLRA